MLQSRMRALLQHVTKIHQGSVNNVVRPHTLLAELRNTKNGVLFSGHVFVKLVCRNFFVEFILFR